MSLEDSSCANTPLFSFEGLSFFAKVLWVFDGNKAYFDVAVLYEGKRVRLRLWQPLWCTARNLHLVPGDMVTVTLGKWKDDDHIIECESST